MDSIRVVFATKTGHSKRLAEAIGKEFGVTARNVTENNQPEEINLLFLIGGIYAGKSNPILLSYAKKLDSSLVRKVVLVTSSVSTSLRSQRDISTQLLESGIDVVDEITCTGGLLFVKRGHPNEVDIRDIVEAAKDIARKVM